MHSIDRMRADFDAIADALDRAEGGDRLPPAEAALLELLPADCGEVLEVGCGHGVLTRRIAPRARQVRAIDLSPGMIRLAGARSAGHEHVRFEVADVMSAELAAGGYDVVVAVAVLHHLPLEPAVRRLAAATRRGGLLLIQDVLDRDALAYLPMNAMAWLARRARGGRPHPALAALYRAHGQGERYLTPRRARRAFAALLPGSRLVHHLEWRYTVVWRRPA